MTTSLTIACIKVYMSKLHTQAMREERERGREERERGREGRERGREGREEGRAWPEYEPGVVKAHHSMVGLQQVS